MLKISFTVKALFTLRISVASSIGLMRASNQKLEIRANQFITYRLLNANKVVIVVLLCKLNITLDLVGKESRQQPISYFRVDMSNFFSFDLDDLFSVAILMSC